MEKLLTVKEVAELMAVQADTVYSLIHSGQLRAIDIGTGKKHYFRIKLTDFESYCGVEA